MELLQVTAKGAQNMPPTPRMQLQNRFRMMEVLGEGPFWQTFHGMDTWTGRDVSVKIARRDRMGEEAFDQLGANLCFVGARSTLLAECVSATVDEAQAATVSEWGAWNLDSYIKERGSNGLEDGALFRILARGVCAVLLLRDLGLNTHPIRPSNLLLLPDPRGPLDFPFEVVLGDACFPCSANDEFVAPELLRGEPSYAAADMWALGAVLRYAAAGTSFRERDEFPRPEFHPISKIVRQLLSLNPLERPTPESLLQGQYLCAVKPPEPRAFPVHRTHCLLEEFVKNDIADEALLRVFCGLCRDVGKRAPASLWDLRSWNVLVEKETLASFFIDLRPVSRDARPARFHGIDSAEKEAACALALLGLRLFSGRKDCVDFVSTLQGVYEQPQSIDMLLQEITKATGMRSTERRELEKTILEKRALEAEVLQLRKAVADLEEKLEARDDEMTELRNTAARFARSFQLTSLPSVRQDTKKDTEGAQFSGLQLAVHTIQKPWVERLMNTPNQVKTLSEIEKKMAAAILSPCNCVGTSASLIEAARNGCVGCCVQYIGQAGAVDGRTQEFALAAATKALSLECVLVLMEKECSMQDVDGTSALMIAVAEGRDEIVEVLAPLSAGLQAGDGSTALMIAARCERLHAIQALRAEYGRVNGAGQTALSIAMDVGASKQIVYELAFSQMEREGMHITPLMVFAYIGDANGVRANMEDCNQQDLSGRTALMYAARNGNAECVELLLDETMCQDNGKKTALMEAAIHNHTECVQILSQQEARITDGTGRTALMLAAIIGSLQAVNVLKTFEAGMVGPKGKSALYYAIDKGQEACVTALWPVAEERASLNAEIVELAKQRFNFL